MKRSKPAKFLSEALPAVILGETSGSSEVDQTVDEWHKHYRPKALVGRGSQNIPLLAAACGLGITFERDRDLHHEILNGWQGYVKLPWGAKEPGTRHIYGSWIAMSTLVAYAFAVRAERNELANDLSCWIRTTATILALGAGWKRDRGGHPVTICGSRSTVSVRVDRTRRQDGKPRELHFLFANPLSTLLDGFLGHGEGDNWEGDVIRACIARTGVSPWDALAPFESAILRRLVKARVPSDITEIDAPLLRDGGILSLVQGWLLSSPSPRTTFDFIKTTEGTATVCEQGINTRSTAPMYGCSWSVEGRSTNSDLNLYPWSQKNKHMDCLFVDDPSRRSEGRAGDAILDMASRTVRAQRRATRDYFDDRTLKFESGTKQLDLPGGPIIWHIEFSNSGVFLDRRDGRL